MPTINPTYPADGDDAIVAPYNAAIALIVSVLNGAVDADNLAAGAVGLSELSSVVAAALNPTGSILAYGGSSAPTGYLLCDGSSQLRASYSAVFAIVGTAFGSADGTHFNLPDLRGRIPVGIDNIGGSAANRIQRTSTLTTVSGSPTATVGSATGLSVGMIIKNANVTAGTTITNINGTTLTLSANATGNGTTIAATFSMLGNDATAIGAVGGTDVHQLITNQLAIHQHTITAYFNASTTGAGNITRGNSGSTDTSVAVNNAGGDQAHPNMQPSVATNYIIKT